jgi:hypothetical protein
MDAAPVVRMRSTDITRWLGLAALLVAGAAPAVPGRYPHIRTQISDYRIGYLPAPERRAEYQWTAQHYDRIIIDWGDDVSLREYRHTAPATEIYKYALEWTVIQPSSAGKPNVAATYYPDMLGWYAAHQQYDIERAFLHRSGCNAPAACRLSFRIWKDDRWAVNPGDAGLRAYARQRVAALARDADGLFLDEHGSGDFEPLLALHPAEYPRRDAYERDVVALLADLRLAIGSNKHLLINTATYITPWDKAMAGAAGGVHGEYFNGAGFADMEARWSFADALLAQGVTMDVTPANGFPKGYSAGNYGSPPERRSMWDLASYYMMAPSRPGLLALNVNGSTWAHAYTETWLPAIATDVGVPTAPRRVMAQGTDGKGQTYRVWSRPFARALVLIRPVTSWSAQAFGDPSGVTVTLPRDGEYHLLRGNGALGPTVTSILLRDSESAILVRR